jgi:uncharacterized protein YndB with AHSA1/START domain
MQTEIKHSWFFKQSPQEVWEYLTKAELIAQWIMRNDFEPVLGHNFQFRTNPIPSLDLDGIFDCKVLEIVPFKKLTYSWKGGPGNGVTTLDTVAAWTLEPKDKGTELQLVHSGFNEANMSIFAGMTKGWLQNIQKMIDLLNTRNNANTNA